MGLPSLSRASQGFLLEKQASGRSAYTTRNYQEHLARLAEYCQDPPLDAITPAMLTAFMVWLREEYVTARGQPLSPKSIKNYWGGLSAFFRWASTQYHIPNPMTLPAPTANLPVVEPLSATDVEALIKSAEYTELRVIEDRAPNKAKRRTALRDKAIILVLVDAGLRVQELCDASIGDLDQKTGRLLVTGKGAKQRMVYLGQVARRAVWLYLSERYPEDEPPADEPLFAQDDGLHRLTRNGVRVLLGRLGTKAGVADVHPHRLRHTFAIEYLRNGGDIFTLQRLLGHSSLDMVRRYLSLAQVDLEDAHRRASPADRWRL